MESIAGSQTEKNLLTAFLGESADQNRYIYYAKVAKKEGYVALSTLFEEIAVQERSHAKNFLKQLEEGTLTISATFDKGVVGSNTENLLYAVRAERKQHESLYPGFAATAKNEGFAKIAVLFSSIAKAEAYHAAKLQSHIDAIENNTVFTDNEPVTWVCAKCGYVHTGNSALEKCPACGHPKAYFHRTDVFKKG